MSESSPSDIISQHRNATPSSSAAVAGLLRSPLELRRLLEENHLPLDENNVVYAFGYGSGVLLQQQQTEKASNTIRSSNTTMVDMIVVVRDAYAFHKANLDRNPHHYAMLSCRSSALCTWVQRHALPETMTWLLRNPGVYFHVTEDHSMKYGVVQIEDLSRDLTDWSYLYLAGRLHKPVVTILADQDDVLEAQQQTRNLPAALAAALLLQWNDDRPHHCSNTIHCLDAHEVYTRIASLSYTGDPRMLIRAEDPNKISNLVRSAGQMERFHNLYQTATANLVREGILSMNDTTTNNQWTWDSTNPLAHARLWQSLPVHVRSQCRYEPNTTNNDGSAATVVSSAAASQRLPAVLASIVAPAARYQSAKGLWTAGLTKSVVYAYRKLSKGLLLKR